MKATLTLCKHHHHHDSNVVEVHYNGKLVATVAGADGPGVRIISASGLTVTTPDTPFPVSLNVVEVSTAPSKVPGLYAWLGEDEFGSGEIGLKQARVPAGSCSCRSYPARVNRPAEGVKSSCSGAASDAGRHLQEDHLAVEVCPGEGDAVDSSV